jgi:putative endonuclease
VEERRHASWPGRRPARRIAGDRAEQLVAHHLARQGWTIIARNVRVGRSELDIVARDPRGTLVIVEVRSRSGPARGMPEESVDASKVARLYAAAWQLLGSGQLPGCEAPLGEARFRVDLVTVVRGVDGRCRLRGHLRGLTPP